MPADDPNPAEGTPEHVRWSDRPRLERPVVLAAFEGWNDAGDAATTAVKALARAWQAEAFASIDPEDFYDFTSTRPHVHLDEQGERQIVWPENLLAGASVQPGLDVITLVGAEPQLKWRTFCSQVTTVARQYDARLVVTLGALLAEVPHTRPTPVYGAGYDTDTTLALGLAPSRYEGPTGIVGVLHAACRDAGLPSVSLWAAVPTYVPAVPSPKASLALVQRLGRLLEVDVAGPAWHELRDEAEQYERQITEVVADDDDTTEYLHQLEAAFDQDDTLLDTGASIADEVERFLREQRD